MKWVVAFSFFAEGQQEWSSTRVVGDGVAQVGLLHLCQGGV